MKNDEGLKVITKDRKRTTIFAKDGKVYDRTKEAQVIIDINVKELEELHREVKKAVKYWKQHNRKGKTKFYRFFQHLNRSTSFYVSFK